MTLKINTRSPTSALPHAPCPLGGAQNLVTLRQVSEFEKWMNISVDGWMDNCCTPVFKGESAYIRVHCDYMHN